MNNPADIRFSGPVTVFQEQRLPEPATPAGYAALIDAFALEVPTPATLCAIGVRHRMIERDGWKLYTPRHKPAATLEGHLTFALKYEGVDLAILNRLFRTIGPKPIVAMVKATPTGLYARRVWFFYEWLTGEELPLPSASGNYVNAIDPKQQWAIEGALSLRHRVRNNMPGTRAFCPLVRRTAALTRFADSQLGERARRVLARVPKDILARTAAFLLLKDSKSSYAIEGERPPQDRIQRWGRAIGEAGRQALDVDELLRLQRIVIGDARFVNLGLRKEGGFVGEHDRESRMPLPDHISARHEDLPDLMRGLITFDQGAARTLEPVIAAATLAFGFVYIHPFEDGNGRLHRYLVHHILAQRGFGPPGVIFPVSSAILTRIEEYRQVLESYSARLLPYIKWEPTPAGNVRVLNETADYYRYFDATTHAEFLFACVEQTVVTDLPEEIAFLGRFDEFRRRVQDLIDMPERTLDTLFHTFRQNGGKLSKRKREGVFAAFSDEEVSATEQIYSETFGQLLPPVADDEAS
jgi:hypothetical protein